MWSFTTIASHRTLNAMMPVQRFYVGKIEIFSNYNVIIKIFSWHINTCFMHMNVLLLYFASKSVWAKSKDGGRIRIKTEKQLWKFSACLCAKIFYYFVHFETFKHIKFILTFYTLPWQNGTSFHLSSLQFTATILRHLILEYYKKWRTSCGL